jgi:uncharacterized membrane protein
LRFFVIAETMAMNEEMGVAASETNIAKILRLEEEEEKRASPVERFSEKVGAFAGTMTFVAAQVLLVIAWTAWNIGLFGNADYFDRYPFPLLANILAFECVLLASFVLIRQTRMSQRGERRSHLDLQINLLTEKEMTKTLQMLEVISRRLGVEDEAMDSEARELSRETSVEKVAQTISENID